MLTSKQVVDQATNLAIPLHGDFQLYQFDTIHKGPRVMEAYMAAEEFRDLAVKARRKAAELLECADSMDAWLLENLDAQ